MYREDLSGGNRRRRRGFSLAELILGMAITAMIGASVAGTTMVLSTAGEESAATYESTQTSWVASRNLSSIFRNARLVTAVDAETVVFWAEDLNGNGDINITEVVMLKYDPSDAILRKYQIVYPGYWSPGFHNIMNWELNLWGLTSAQSVAAWMTDYCGYTQVTVLAENVHDLQIAASPNPPVTNVITMEMTVGDPGSEVPLRAVGHLRGCEADRVQANNGYYVLNP